MPQLRKTAFVSFSIFTAVLLVLGASAIHHTIAATHLDLDRLLYTADQPPEKGIKDFLNEAKVGAIPPAVFSEELLWLARCIYSETKRPYEQELVAWVIRNRLESRYRGKESYKAVVLDSYQFSAFNSNSHVRRFYTSLAPTSRAPGWQTALRIAQHVMMADHADRPFSVETRHFYSEQSMVGRRAPNWAEGMQPVPIKDRPILSQRFRFYERVI